MLLGRAVTERSFCLPPLDHGSAELQDRTFVLSLAGGVTTPARPSAARDRLLATAASSSTARASTASASTGSSPRPASPGRPSTATSRARTTSSWPTCEAIDAAVRARVGEVPETRRPPPPSCVRASPEASATSCAARASAAARSSTRPRSSRTRPSPVHRAVVAHRAWLAEHGHPRLPHRRPPRPGRGVPAVRHAARRRDGRRLPGRPRGGAGHAAGRPSRTCSPAEQPANQLPAGRSGGGGGSEDCSADGCQGQRTVAASPRGGSPCRRVR